VDSAVRAQIVDSAAQAESVVVVGADVGAGNSVCETERLLVGDRATERYAAGIGAGCMVSGKQGSHEARYNA
jgi:hypothetical protein